MLKILSDNQKVIIKQLVINECCSQEEKFQLHITIFTNPPIKSTQMTTNLSTTQQVSGQVTPTNSLGNTAQVEAGTVDYSSSDPAIAEVVEDPADETKFTVVAKGAGVATITFTADADLGEGVVTISGELGVDVHEAGATRFGLTLGEVTEQPAP